MARASEEDEEHSGHKHQKLKNNSCKDKSQIHEKRKVREVSNSESSEDEQFSYLHCHQKMKWTEK